MRSELTRNRDEPELKMLAADLRIPLSWFKPRLLELRGSLAVPAAVFGGEADSL